MKHTLSVLVENKPGVLTRVAGLFARRGFNIDSLVVAETENPQLSRMTITVDEQDQPVEQVTKQLHKLINVLKITDLDPAGSVERELLLIKVKADAQTAVGDHADGGDLRGEDRRCDQRGAAHRDDRHPREGGRLHRPAGAVRDGRADAHRPPGHEPGPEGDLTGRPTGRAPAAIGAARGAGRCVLPSPRRTEIGGS